MKPGDLFEHASQLDLQWRPGPGQKYADAPKRPMVITRVTRDTVHYKAFVSEIGSTGWHASHDSMETGGRIVGRWITSDRRKYMPMAMTMLTESEINTLARGLAALVDPDADPISAHDASGVVHRALRGNNSQSGHQVRALATHLAELSYEVQR